MLCNSSPMKMELAVVHPQTNPTVVWTYSNDEPPDHDQSVNADPPMVSDIDVVLVDSHTVVAHVSPLKTDPPKSAPLSYKDSFLGDIKTSNAADVEIIEEEDIVLLDNDVVEYESLPTICFECGKYGHVQDIFPLVLNPLGDLVSPPPTQQAVNSIPQTTESYGPWMMVEWRTRKTFRNNSKANIISVITHAPPSLPSIQGKSTSSIDPPTHSNAAVVFPVMDSVDKGIARDLVLPSRRSSTLSAARFAPFSRDAPVIDKSEHTSIVISENDYPNVVVSGIDDPAVAIDNPLCDASFSIPAKPPDKVGMSTTIVSTQGCGHPKFLTSVKQYLRDDNPDILGIVEPCISGSLADVVIGSLGFAYSHKIEASSFSSGIWLCWRDEIRVVVLMHHFQFLHCRISYLKSGFSSLLTIVYASPTVTRRKSLWPHLQNLSLSVDSPWILMSDFNVTLDPYDRKGGTGSTRACKDFQSFIFGCGLRDMGYMGLDFTWNRGYTYARLDHILCNDKWDEMFPEASVHHFSVSVLITVPFCLRLGILYVPMFPVSLNTLLDGILMTILAVWKNYFGVRSRVPFGSHMVIEIRPISIERRRFANHAIKVSCLKMFDGSCCDDEVTLRNEAANYSKDLFLTLIHPMVHDALMDMSPLKAPGPDGLHTEFYQK
ncbi:hypothetical protein V6N13_046272 [Hibiscus sabdariffa]